MQLQMASKTGSNHMGEALVVGTLRNALRNRAIFVKSWEGCRADGRVLVSGGCGALAIQIKTTKGIAKGTSNQYKFQGTAGYGDCMVICCAIDERLFWLIPGHQLKSNTLTITLGGKWDRYKVAENRLADKLLAVDEGMQVSTHEPSLFEPLAPKQQLEVEGMRAMMRHWPVRLTMPDQEQGPVDCWLGDARASAPSKATQCKTAYKYRDISQMRVDLSNLNCAGLASRLTTAAISSF